jgi:hypothetical protein
MGMSDSCSLRVRVPFDRYCSVRERHGTFIHISFMPNSQSITAAQLRRSRLFILLQGILLAAEVDPGGQRPPRLADSQKSRLDRDTKHWRPN